MIHTVLIVDDEPAIRDGLFGFHWESLGFVAVDALQDGEQALTYILTNPVDVVICDIRMPKMDGLAFAQEVWNRKLKSIVVLLTGFKDMEYIRQAMRYGCRDYLLKPTRFKQLEELFIHLKQELDALWIENPNKEFEEGLIGAAKSYIHSHLESVSLDTVAVFLQLSPTYFSKLFKERTDMHFSDYCQQERMTLAKQLLSDPRKQIQDIAQQTGYSNATNFARAFKMQCGISPTEFREQEMNQIDKN